MLSYAGQLDFTTVTDRDGFPALHVFVAGVRGSLVELGAA